MRKVFGFKGVIRRNNNRNQDLVSFADVYMRNIPVVFTKIVFKLDYSYMEPFTIFNNEEQQQFQATINGESASLEYRLYDGKIVLMHTEVPENLGGRGIGSALAHYALDYARTRHLPVKVYCPFVLTFLKRHPEYQDLVVKTD